jgi:nucleoside-diphosphate-sugar epimerase
MKSLVTGATGFLGTNLVRELGYRIVPLSRMVDDAYEWYREEGWL